MQSASASHYITMLYHHLDYRSAFVHLCIKRAEQEFKTNHKYKRAYSQALFRQSRVQNLI